MLLAQMFKDKPVKLPQELINFLQQPLLFESLEMPQAYANPEQFDWFQIGYRVHGITHEDLTSTATGAFQPSWYVIAHNEMADPFFIDLTEQAQGFPVYFGLHGQGNWQAEQVASSLAQFTHYLTQIKQLEQNTASVLAYVADIAEENEFWCGVEHYYQELLNAADDAEFLPVNHQLNPQDWQQVQLYLLALGEHKLEVIKFVKNYLKLSLPQALADTKKLPLRLNTGARRFMQVVADDLSALGAQVELVVVN